MELKILQLNVKSITIFRNLLHNKVIKKYMYFLESAIENSDDVALVDSYCSFVHELYNHNMDFSRYLIRQIMNDENIYTRYIQDRREIPDSLEKQLTLELGIFEQIADLAGLDITDYLTTTYQVPDLTASAIDFTQEYLESIKDAHRRGFGIYSRYHTFIYKNSKVVPIKNHDPISLDKLVGYERERELVIKNTLAFINGQAANNTLLYGDAGTGKSSTVKAIVNRYHDQGLRLIEIKKQQIEELDDIIELLAGNPLKFIIFIDDLSFATNNDSFIALKNILEGGIVSSRNNIIVYATSNRRHLVKENMKNRDGDELFANDSIQETLSLAARFGLTVTFSKPLKKLYLDLCTAMAKEYDLETDEAFYKRAEAFALRNNGRSPRTAKQFVEFELVRKIKI